MYNYVDIAIAVIFLFMMVDGWIKGLVRSIIGLIGYIAAFFVAKFYYVDVSKWLLSNFSWFGELKQSITDTVLASFNSNAQLQTQISAGYGSDVSEALKNKAVLDQLNLPLDISDKVGAFVSGVDIGASQKTAVEGLADLIASGVIYALSFVLIILGVILLVKIIGLILDVATEVPIIKQANKLGGFLFGAVKACFFVFLIMMAITFLAPIAPQFEVIESINTSAVGVYFYNNNILLLLLDIFLD